MTAMQTAAPEVWGSAGEPGSGAGQGRMLRLRTKCTVLLPPAPPNAAARPQRPAIRPAPRRRDPARGLPSSPPRSPGGAAAQLRGMSPARHGPQRPVARAAAQRSPAAPPSPAPAGDATAAASSPRRPLTLARAVAPLARTAPRTSPRKRNQAERRGRGRVVVKSLPTCSGGQSGRAPLT